MANNDPNNTLQAAYAAGYEAFKSVVQNERGFYHNPANPHGKNSLYYKEWERGYAQAYTDNLSGTLAA